MKNNSPLLGLMDLSDENNPTPRVPVCLCLDTSISMDRSIGGTTPMKEMNEGVKKFYESIKKHGIASYAADICIITFGGKAELVQDFENVSENKKPPSFKATGYTPMGEAVALALDCLKRRRNWYKQKGIDHFKPWLVIMTDGQPNGDPRIYDNAKAEVISMETENRLAVFPIGVGGEADMKALADFSKKRPPLKMKGIKFEEFFEWLSRSIQTTSTSIPGNSPRLPAPDGWAELHM